MLFWLLWTLFLFINLTVLYVLRKHPIYEPRVLFSLSSLMWLIIAYGVLYGFENYLAFKSMFYVESIDSLVLKTMLLFLLGYLSFIIGASSLKLKKRLIYSSSQQSLYNSSFNIAIFIFILIGLCNFFFNVILISNGNVLDYIVNTAGRHHQVAEGLGVSAIGYLFGFIAINFIMYNLGKENYSKKTVVLLLVLFTIFILVKLSQGRIFQTLVFIGSSYFAYLIGAKDNIKNISYLKSLKVFVIFILMGVYLYYLRIVSAFEFSGRGAENFSLDIFFQSFIHFAIERGNVPNVPIVMTIIDKVDQEGYLIGTSLFNWFLNLIPKSILPPDYLISLWIKNTWYMDIEGGGLPPTAIGEWYANYGYVGVILGMFLVGLLLKFFYNKMLISNSPFWAVFWANLSFGFILIYPKTDLAQIPSFTFVLILILYFLYLVIKELRSLKLKR